MSWEEVLTNDQFWLGLVAVLGVGATVVAAFISSRTQKHLAQSRNDRERRRLRRDELARVYAQVGDHCAKVVLFILYETHGDVPDVSDAFAPLFTEGRSRKQSLLLYGASQDVINAWNRFDTEVERAGQIGKNGGKPDAERLDEELRGLYEAFNRHLEDVWPSPEAAKSNGIEQPIQARS